MDRSAVRGKDLDSHFGLPSSKFRRGCHAVEILDQGAHGDLARGFVDETGFAASGEFMFVRCQSLQRRSLGWCEKGLQGGKRRSVLDLTVSDGTLAPLLKSGKALRLSKGGEFKFWVEVGQPHHTLHPLLRFLLPGRQRKISLRQRCCQNLRGFFARRGVAMDRLQYEVTKYLLRPLHYAVGGRVEEVVVLVGEVLGEEIPQHLLVDCRGHGELDADIAASLSDLADFRSYHEAAFRGSALLGEESPPAVHDVAEVGPHPSSAGHLIGESCKDAPGQSLVRCRWCIHIESLPLGQFQELLVDFCRLACGITMDGELPAAVSSEIVFLSPSEGSGHH